MRLKSAQRFESVIVGVPRKRACEARRGSGSIAPDLCSHELIALGGDPFEQLVERIGELLDALALEQVDHVVVVDTGRRERLEGAVRLVKPLLKRRLGLAVILERFDRRPAASC